jgi:hypothetical protein
MLHAVYRVGDMQVTGVQLQPLPPTALHQAEQMAEGLTAPHAVECQYACACASMQKLASCVQCFLRICSSDVQIACTHGC